jgi:hypothetical protein
MVGNCLINEDMLISCRKQETVGADNGITRGSESGI